MRKLLPSIGLTLAALLGLGAALAHAQILAKRLIMKDGSYQAVSKYQVKGNRVRYLSAERNDWEEVPSSLVDWDATRKYEQERANGAPPPESAETEKELQAEAAADRAAEAAATPTVAPGLHLPDMEGVFVLDSFQSQPQLIEVQQNSGEINRNTTSNILRSTINPLAGSKQTIELKGQHAPVQAHTARPVFYVKLEEDAATDTKIHSRPSQPAASSGPQLPSSPQSTISKPQRPEGPQGPQQPLTDSGQHYRLVRMEQKKDVRVVGALKIAVYGKMSQQTGTVIPTTSERISGNWIKITPLHDLAPGEYALVEMLSPKEMNLYVWDFGVNPAAPANPSAWKPEPAPATAQQPPALDKRP
jgi:hypothetical protein